MKTETGKYNVRYYNAKGKHIKNSDEQAKTLKKAVKKADRTLASDRVYGLTDNRFIHHYSIDHRLYNSAEDLK